MTPINPLTGLPVDDTEIKLLSDLANQQIAVEAELAMLEELMKRKQAELKELQFVRIPQRMLDLGMRNFKMTNGAAVEIKKFYSCSLSEEDPARKEEALKWLKRTGHGNIIKHVFTATLGNEADALVASLRGFLNKKSISHKDSKSVPNPTLKAFMKEQIENAREFPLDLFKGFCGDKTIITIK